MIVTIFSHLIGALREGHWGILETTKPKKNHPKPQNRQKIRSKPKTSLTLKIGKHKNHFE